MKIVLVTGGFDPLHSGHIAYLTEAAKLGDKLWVGLNSDRWLANKKGAAFLPYKERVSVVKALGVVDRIIEFDDSNGNSSDAIEQVLSATSSEVIFANGGDRNNENTPEYEKYWRDPRVEFVFGVGGEDKKNSSSGLLDRWKTMTTERDWGYWRVLDDKQPVLPIKVKELVIKPRHSLSMQKHNHRSEMWYVLDGKVDIDTEYNGIAQTHTLHSRQHFVINQDVWHRAYNTSDKDVYILEVQYGEQCIEDDIERKPRYVS